MKIDGWIGKTTMNNLYKLKSYDKPSLLKVINGLQFMRYYNIVKRNLLKKNFSLDG